MTTLYIKPLTFDCKKNEITLGIENIEWKKQIAIYYLHLEGSFSQRSKSFIVITFYIG